MLSPHLSCLQGTHGFLPYNSNWPHHQQADKGHIRRRQKYRRLHSFLVPQLFGPAVDGWPCGYRDTVGPPSSRPNPAVLLFPLCVLPGMRPNRDRNSNCSTSCCHNQTLQLWYHYQWSPQSLSMDMSRMVEGLSNACCHQSLHI